jgi:hypothetical protein
MKNWKQQYEENWFRTPKKLRKTKTQINNIRSQAKLYIAIYGN